MPTVGFGATLTSTRNDGILESWTDIDNVLDLFRWYSCSVGRLQ